jgi:hypothetical protein
MKIRIFNKLLSQKLFSIVLLMGILANAFSAGAQTRRGNSRTISANQSKPTAQKCSGAWTGTITYTRTQKSKDRKTTDRVSNRGTNERQTEMNYDYTAKIIVGESPARDASSVGKGKVEYFYEAIDKTISEEQNSCDRGKTWRTMRGESSTEIKAYVSPATNVEANVRVGVNANGSYTVNVAIPQTQGKTSGSMKTSYSNQCVPKEGKTNNTQETPISVEGQSLTSDGSHFIDPKNPNSLSGSYSLKLSETAVETISWNLQKCGAPLRIIDLEFYQLTYPSPNTWEKIDEGYTIDGNDVKIVATIANFSGESKRATVNFKELNENMELPGGKIDADFAPNQEKEVEFIWDTSGFSWKQSTPFNESDVSRHIEASIPTDKKVAPVEVRHKPVVIIPGIWSKKEKLFRLEDFFKAKGWATTVPPVNIKKRAIENAPIIEKTVREIQEKENAWHVDLIGHSTGGLAARAYIDSFMPGQYDNRPVATHLVMLGTPNMGTPCASGVETIFTKIFVRNPDAFSEISHKNTNEFNKVVRSRHGTKFYAIAGDAIKQTCQLEAIGDGVVPFMSAIYKSKVYALTNVSHEDLAGDQGVFTQLRTWLAVPPKGNHAPDNLQALNGNCFSENDYAALENEVFGKTRRYGAMFQPASLSFSSVADEPEPNFATGVKLKANQSTEIEIPLTNGSVLSLVLYTSPEVSATLIDEKGEIVGKNLAGSAEAAGIFRTITIRKPLRSGKWKLKLENRAGEDTETLATLFIDYNSTVFTAK